VLRIPCPYLGSVVELTTERERHIQDTHPDLLPAYFDQFAVTVADPGEVRLDEFRDAMRLFSRWFPEVKGGKFIVVAIVSNPAPARRHWVRTPYIAKRLVTRTVEWKRDSQ